MMRLSPRVILIYSLLQLFAVSLGLIGEGLFWVALFFGIFFALLIWDYVTIRKLVHSAPIEASIKMQRQLALGDRAQIELEISSSEVGFELIDWDLPENDAYVTHSAGDFWQRRIETHKLAYCQIRDIQLRGRSRLDFWIFRTQVTLKEPVRFRIHPPLVRLKTEDFVELYSGLLLTSEGQRRLSRGQQREIFESFRPYQYPDSLSLIDAKKSAQLGEVLVRQYSSHHDHHLVICLDIGRNMAGQIMGSDRADYYISAAMKLVENAILSRDRVSLIAYSDRILFQVRNSRRLADFAPLVEGKIGKSQQVESAVLSLPKWITPLAGGRSIVVLLTDLERPNVQDALLEALGPVCQKHMTAVIGLSDPDNNPEIYLSDLNTPSGISKDKNKPPFDQLMAGYLYGLQVSDRTWEFSRKFSRLGGLTLTVDERRWLSAVSELYRRLRFSSQTG